MNITVSVSLPPLFAPLLDEQVALSQAGSREVFVAQLLRGYLIDQQLRKEFGGSMMQRGQELASYWTGLPSIPPPLSAMTPQWGGKGRL